MIRLGYVGVPSTFDDITYNHTVTYTQYETMDEEKRKEKLNFLIQWNLEELQRVLRYNIQNGITFYRISHNVIPLATHPNVYFDYISPYITTWKEIGNFIKEKKMRIDTHPDQFCVLNSTNQEVIESSIRLLEFQKKIFDAMGIHGQCILHVGGGVLDKKAGLERFKKTFQKLPKEIQSLLILENDDVIYTATDVLELCEELEIPMVLDYHHYLVHHESEKINELLPRIIKTWSKTSLKPKMHFSTAKSKKELRTHHDYIKYSDFIKFLELLKPLQTDIDIMLECKKKDEALLRLIREIRFKQDYSFLNESTFLI